MRITNKIMQNNSLNNINYTKVMEDKLNTQMATGNKLTRPSDDPVVAIRSLRLSTNVSKLVQYNEKNAEDADKWLTVTEDAIVSMNEIISDMYHQCEKGVGDDMNTSNYLAILEQLKSLRDETYACGDADYAGRNLFTGYRTESKLGFQEATTLEYSIHQSVTLEDVETKSYINTGDVLNYTEANGFGSDETDVSSAEYKRIRLAYDNLDGLNPVDMEYVETDASGNQVTRYITFQPISSTDVGAYTPAADVNYVLVDTGELILGQDAYDAMSNLPNDTEYTITYNKTEWSKADLRPEHYFDCEATKVNPDGTTNLITYESGNRQDIYYDLGANQTLKVNTHAGEVFTHDIGRDVDDLEVMINQLKELDGIVEKLVEKISLGLSGTDLEEAEIQLAAAKKAQTLKKDQVQKAFGATMTSMQGYQDMANVAITSVGTRGSRLELIQNRLSSQQDSFKELLHENDKKNIEETTTELASAKLAYDAALSATSKILQNSLMDYI